MAQAHQGRPQEVYVVKAGADQQPAMHRGCLNKLSGLSGAQESIEKEASYKPRFLESPLSWASSPECRILVSMWSLVPLLLRRITKHRAVALARAACSQARAAPLARKTS